MAVLLSWLITRRPPAGAAASAPGPTPGPRRRRAAGALRDLQAAGAYGGRVRAAPGAAPLPLVPPHERLAPAAGGAAPRPRGRAASRLLAPGGAFASSGDVRLAAEPWAAVPTHRSHWARGSQLPRRESAPLPHLQVHGLPVQDSHSAATAGLCPPPPPALWPLLTALRVSHVQVTSSQVRPGGWREGAWGRVRPRALAGRRRAGGP